MIRRKLIKRTAHNPAEGTLCVAEARTPEIPFEIKRVYYTYGAEKDIVRGNHAHKKLEQILMCPYGSIEVTLDDGHSNTETVILNDPSITLYVGPSTWRTMKWLRSNSVLLVLASEHYDESDYIRDYESFIYWVNGKEGENSEI